MHSEVLNKEELGASSQITREEDEFTWGKWDDVTMIMSR